MWLLMAYYTVKRLVGISIDILVKVDNFIFPVDFIVLDCEVDFKMPIILKSPFLAIGRALMGM